MLIFLFRPSKLAKATHRDRLTNLAIDICKSLQRSGALLPYVDKIAIVEARVTTTIAFKPLSLA